MGRGNWSLFTLTLPSPLKGERDINGSKCLKRHPRSRRIFPHSKGVFSLKQLSQKVLPYV